MKKIWVLVAVAAFLVTGGVLTRLSIYDAFAVVPADIDAIIVAETARGEPATYFSIADLAEKRAPLTNVTVARSDAKASEQASDDLGRDVVVVDTYSCTDPTRSGGDCRTNDLPLSGSASTIAVDRQTGEAMRWKGNSESTGGKTKTDVPFEGMPLKFPFNTPHTTYRSWDSDLGTTVANRFVKQTTRKGLKVLEYRTEVEATKVGTVDLPGSLVGSDQATVKADLMHSTTGVSYVEPETGLPVDGGSVLDDYAAIDGKRVLTTVSGSLDLTAEQVASQIADTSKTADQLHLLRVTIPTALVAGGVLLLLLAGALAVRRHRRRPLAPVEDAPRTREPAGQGATR